MTLFLNFVIDALPQLILTTYSLGLDVNEDYVWSIIMLI